MPGAAIHLQTSQGANMSAQLQHGLKMLQMSALELEQEVAALLADNPLLERPDEAGDEQAAGLWPEARSGSAAIGDDAEPSTPAPVTLREHLLQQVAVSALSAHDAAMARLVVEALDEDGYLRDGPAEIFVALSREPRRAAGDVAIPLLAPDAFEQAFGLALRFVQSLDPAGVGARSVAECLALQLRRLSEDEPARALALRIAEDCLDLLAANDVSALTRRLGCDDAALGAARALLRSLAPRPAQAFAADEPRYLVPEVIVRQGAGRWVVTANPDASPQLRINRAYASVLRGARGWSNTPLGAQLNEARWLLRNLRQRADTIVRVAEAIVEAQQGWFEHGDIAIRPLFLRDIAARTGLHESTISRVTAGKYMATPRGPVEFKHFFGSRLAADDGFRMSPRSVQVLIRDIVAAEDPQRPLSDIRLTRVLAQRGVKLARRTVTKYRDALGIPPLEARRLNAMSAA
jgi:RNA polymerase sigma-54 factor